MTGHIKETDLALFASGDLRLWERMRTQVHVRRCELCREKAEEFRADRKAVREAAAKLPEGLDWARLAAEMTANIHVGLAAGECVSLRGKARRTVPEIWRPLALASAMTAMLAVMLVGAWWLNVPAQDTQALSRAMRSIWHGRTVMPADRGPAIEASADGIELRKNGGSLAVSQNAAQLMTVSVSTQGSASAHYVDQDTGQVTITSVYEQ
jgi:hypothetical protein